MTAQTTQHLLLYRYISFLPLHGKIPADAPVSREGFFPEKCIISFNRLELEFRLDMGFERRDQCEQANSVPGRSKDK